jgi:hypothetical protein
MFKNIFLYAVITALIMFNFSIKAKESIEDTKDYCTGVVDLSLNCLGGEWIPSPCAGTLIHTLSGSFCLPKQN